MHHREAIPYLSLALGPYRIYLHTYSHEDPTAKYKHEANQKKHFRFTSLIPIQPYPNPAERSQPSRSISTHIQKPQQASQGQPYPSVRHPSPASLHQNSLMQSRAQHQPFPPHGQVKCTIPTPPSLPRSRKPAEKK